MPAESVVRALLDHTADALTDHGDLDRAREGCERLLRDGNGAMIQRDLLHRTDSLRDVVTECVRHTQE